MEQGDERSWITMVMSTFSKLTHAPRTINQTPVSLCLPPITILVQCYAAELISRLMNAANARHELKSLIALV